MDGDSGTEGNSNSSSPPMGRGDLSQTDVIDHANKKRERTALPNESSKKRRIERIDDTEDVHTGDTTEDADSNQEDGLETEAVVEHSLAQQKKTLDLNKVNEALNRAPNVTSDEETSDALSDGTSDAKSDGKTDENPDGKSDGTVDRKSEGKSDEKSDGKSDEKPGGKSDEKPGEKPKQNNFLPTSTVVPSGPVGSGTTTKQRMPSLSEKITEKAKIERMLMPPPKLPSHVVNNKELLPLKVGGTSGSLGSVPEVTKDGNQEDNKSDTPTEGEPPISGDWVMAPTGAEIRKEIQEENAELTRKQTIEGTPPTIPLEGTSYPEALLESSKQSTDTSSKRKEPVLSKMDPPKSTKQFVPSSTAPEDSEPTTLPESSKQSADTSSKREESVPSSVLEKGIIYFFYSPRVALTEAPQGIEDVARSYFILRRASRYHSKQALNGKTNTKIRITHPSKHLRKKMTFSQIW